MHAILLATADESRRVTQLDRLSAAGFPVATCASAGDLLVGLAQRSTRLVLVDGELGALDGSLIATVAAAVPHAPEVYCIHGSCPPLTELSNSGIISRAKAIAHQAASRFDRALLPLSGFGPDAALTLQSLREHPLPVRLQGERGTGKKWFARLVHRMHLPGRPFVLVEAGETAAIRDTEPGTFYLEDIEVHGRNAILQTCALARATGWRVMAGSRRAPDPALEGRDWTHLEVAPLRQRPADLRPLARLYLDAYRTRLGLPRRRITPALWRMIERHAWPGNQRELETFIVQAATSARGASLAPSNLPPRVLALLDPDALRGEETRAFEALAERRLRPVVANFTPGAQPTLHRLVIDATERALIRLALARCGGSQKAAAELLGIARNTLRSRMARLDPYPEQP